jgi:hypothetical protein
VASPTRAGDGRADELVCGGGGTSLVSGVGAEEMSCRVVGPSVHPVITEPANNAAAIGNTRLIALTLPTRPADIDLATDEGDYTSWPT